jgi:hypothetical protein
MFDHLCTLADVLKFYYSSILSEEFLNRGWHTSSVPLIFAETPTGANNIPTSSTDSVLAGNTYGIKETVETMQTDTPTGAKIPTSSTESVLAGNVKDVTKHMFAPWKNFAAIDTGDNIGFNLGCINSFQSIEGIGK